MMDDNRVEIDGMIIWTTADPKRADELRKGINLKDRLIFCYTIIGNRFASMVVAKEFLDSKTTLDLLAKMMFDCLVRPERDKMRDAFNEIFKVLEQNKPV